MIFNQGCNDHLVRFSDFVESMEKHFLILCTKSKGLMCQIILQTRCIWGSDSLYLVEINKYY